MTVKATTLYHNDRIGLAIRNGSTTVDAFTRTPDGQPIDQRMRDKSTGTISSYYYLSDGLGSTVALVDSAGSTTAVSTVCCCVGGGEAKSSSSAFLRFVVWPCDPNGNGCMLLSIVRGRCFRGVCMWRAILGVTIAAAVFAGALAPNALATTRTFLPIADSYVSESNPTAAHGLETELRVHSTPVRRSYLRFAVSGLDGPVSSAMLRLYTETASSVGYEVRGLPSAAWEESTLTYASSPAPSATVSGSSGPHAAFAWAAAPVAPLVRGNGTIDVVVTTSVAVSDWFMSRESTTPPELVVVTDAGAPPPGPALTTTPRNPTNATTAHFAYSDSAAGVTFLCRLDTAAFGACPGAVDYTGLAAGAHTFAVEARDAAGRVSTATTYGWTIDTTPPPAPTLTSFPPNPSNTSSATFAFSDAEAGVTFSCDLDGAAAATCTSPTTYSALAPGAHTFGVKAQDAAGNIGARTAYAWSVTAPPASVRIAAAGDIACDPDDIAFKAGAGTPDACAAGRTAAVIDGLNVSAVLPLGDAQYSCGTLPQFRASYALSWGRFLSITHPVPGNHEYVGGVSGCDPTNEAKGYWGYFGAAAGTPGKGWYSYDLGGWHLIALNSECAYIADCGIDSPEEKWLRADLAAHPAKCTLAYWHRPRFVSDAEANASYDAWWRDLQAAGADVVLVAHRHYYERFAPQRPDTTPDPNGIREFVVGTGGKTHHAPTTIARNSEVINASTYGVLQMTLNAGSYDWKFVPIAGGTFTDSGSTPCH
jgi:hypothetical protein